MSLATETGPMLSQLRKRFDSLTSRAIVAVLIGIGVVHFLSLWTYQQTLSREIGLSNDGRLADQLLTIKRSVVRVPPDERESVAHDLSGGPIEAHWSRTEHAIPGGPGADRWESLGQRLRELAPELAEDGLIIGSNQFLADDPHFALISMRLPDQTWVNVRLVSWTPRVADAHSTLVSTSFMALGAILISILLVRWLTRPLRTFSDAAKALYRTDTASHVPETGPLEVRELATAFNEMQGRIAKLINDRTQALAAVSHDLKTPITRLRFRAEEIADTETRASVTADLDDMERMIDQTLAFLRGDRSDEETRPLDVVALLATIVDDFTDRGATMTIEAPPSAVLLGRRLSLKRAFVNLVDNAVKYGGEANVSVSEGPRTVEVSIADRGPGIAREDVGKALAPFGRLEPSRNNETGGFGLGLAIAQAIVDGHGGSLEFGDRDGGGLVVKVRLPRRKPLP